MERLVKLTPAMKRMKIARVIRKGAYKLIEYFENGELELYNLEEDPGESHNLASELPGKSEELRQKLETWRLENSAQMLSPNPDYNPVSKR